MNDKKQYIAPQLTVVTFKTERGYTVSGTPVAGFFELFDMETSEAQTQESWSEHGTWDNSGNNFF